MEKTSTMHPEIVRNRTARLDYLQQMLREMRELAEAERCDMLVYLIEMAYLEASDIIRGLRPSRIRRDQRNAAPGVPLKTASKV
ncbi:hypothetical protein GA830_13345 [Mesorhizobium sp. NBSH29]|nr:hypothetical protein GA830_13345 [Mesorhizobium sp. NBSH29]